MIEMAAIDRVGVNRFFALISWRYEPGPMVLTSNQSFGAWGEVFGDRVIPTAILDRLLHHAVMLKVRGNGSGSRKNSMAVYSGHLTTMVLNRVGKFELRHTGEILWPLTESRKNGAEDTVRLRLSAARDTVNLAGREWRRGLAHWFQPRAPTSAQAWGRPWVPI